MVLTDIEKTQNAGFKKMVTANNRETIVERFTYRKNQHCLQLARAAPYRRTVLPV
jgi:hypothetical protein